MLIDVRKEVKQTHSQLQLMSPRVITMKNIFIIAKRGFDQIKWPDNERTSRIAVKHTSRISLQSNTLRTRSSILYMARKRHPINTFFGSVKEIEAGSWTLVMINSTCFLYSDDEKTIFGRPSLRLNAKTSISDTNRPNKRCSLTKKTKLLS